MLKRCLLLATSLLFVFVLLLQNFSRTLFRTKMDDLTPAIASSDHELFEILGRLDPDKRYVVFAVTPQSLTDVSLLPDAVLAWKRIQFHSVVIATDSLEVWNSDPKLFEVLSHVRQLEAVVIFLRSYPDGNFVLKQVLLAENFLKYRRIQRMLVAVMLKQSWP